VVVLEKGPPFAEAQIGSDEGGFLLVPFLHEGEEKAHLHGLDLDVADLVDVQEVVGKVFTSKVALGIGDDW
jgi:hypothetical protein